MTGNDWFRVVVFLVATANLGSVVTVLAVYFWTWWRSPATQTRLPLHIWTIALSYIDMVAIVALLIWARLNAFVVPTYAVLTAYGIGALVGVYSMIKIGAQQIERLRGIRE